MSLVWTQFPFDDLDRVFDDAFNGTFNAVRPRIQGNGDNQNQVSRAFRPRMDVHEGKDTNLVTATFELPGLKKDDVTIDVHNGRLTVSGSVNTSSEETKDGYVVRERRSGKFSRERRRPSNRRSASPS
ncbi:HSP20-like chaperone, partial [Exidia glandulosa HHB12029]